MARPNEMNFSLSSLLSYKGYIGFKITITIERIKITRRANIQRETLEEGAC